jgi:hypothetical protein
MVCGTKQDGKAGAYGMGAGVWKEWVAVAAINKKSLLTY